MPGFNVESSDPEAILIADKVMNAMGGRNSWDDTKAISWTFFGKRRLIWDKHSGNVRIDFTDTDEIIIVNIHNTEGRAFANGKEITNKDTLANYLQKGKSIWINDSYWLVMPFKMKDTGVTLHYLGLDTLNGGQDHHLIQLTFENVGDTPENAYYVWVDSEKYLVNQWAFFRNWRDPEPAFIHPWKDYKKYGELLLSGNRGSGRSLTDIMVMNSLPQETFESFEEIKL